MRVRPGLLLGIPAALIRGSGPSPRASADATAAASSSQGAPHPLCGSSGGCSCLALRHRPPPGWKGGRLCTRSPRTVAVSHVQTLALRQGAPFFTLTRETTWDRGQLRGETGSVIGARPPPPRFLELASSTSSAPACPASSILASQSAFPFLHWEGRWPPGNGPLSPGPGSVPRRAAFLRLLLSLSVPSACWPSSGGWNALPGERCSCGFRNAASAPCAPWAVPDEGRRRRHPFLSCLPEPRSCDRDP